MKENPTLVPLFSLLSAILLIGLSMAFEAYGLFLIIGLIIQLALGVFTVSYFRGR